MISINDIYIETGIKKSRIYYLIKEKIIKSTKRYGTTVLTDAEFKKLLEIEKAKRESK